MDQDTSLVEVYSHTRKEQGQYPATKQAWSHLKDTLYVITPIPTLTLRPYFPTKVASHSAGVNSEN